MFNRTTGTFIQKFQVKRELVGENRSPRIRLSATPYSKSEWLVLDLEIDEALALTNRIVDAIEEAEEAC